MSKRPLIATVPILIACVLGSCAPSEAQKSATASQKSASATAKIATSDALKAAIFQTETAAPPPAPKSGHRDTSGVSVGMLADDVLLLRGQADRTVVVGEDQFGLIVEWWYPDAVYTMARRESEGVDAYRVTATRAP